MPVLFLRAYGTAKWHLSRSVLNQKLSTDFALAHLRELLGSGCRPINRQVINILLNMPGINLAIKVKKEDLREISLRVMRFLSPSVKTA